MWPVPPAVAVAVTVARFQARHLLVSPHLAAYKWAEQEVRTPTQVRPRCCQAGGRLGWGRSRHCPLPTWDHSGHRGGGPWGWVPNKSLATEPGRAGHSPGAQVPSLMRRAARRSPLPT